MGRTSDSRPSRKAPLPRDATSKLIDHAMREKRRLALVYKGHARVVEPQIYGVDSTGHLWLSAYQVRGTRSTGGSHGWVHCRLEEVEGLKLLDEHFLAARPDYNPDDKRFATVYSQL